MWIVFFKQFNGLPAIPRMYQLIILFQYGFEKHVITRIIFSNQYLELDVYKRQVDKLVIRIGRKRDTAESSIASRMDKPANLRWLANSTIKIPFFETNPTLSLIHIYSNQPDCSHSS